MPLWTPSGRSTFRRRWANRSRRRGLHGSYGIPAGLIYSYPLVSRAEGTWSIVPDLPIDDEAHKQIDASAAELVSEHEAVQDLLGRRRDGAPELEQSDRSDGARSQIRGPPLAGLARRIFHGNSADPPATQDDPTVDYPTGDGQPMAERLPIATTSS